MGSKKSSTNTTTNQQTHLTTTPTNPAWVDSGLAGIGQTLTNLGGMDAHSFVAGADPLQTLAGQGAAGLTTSPLYGQASDIFNRVAGTGANTYNPATGTAVTGTAATGNAASLLDNLGAYMSPYTNDVVNTTLAGFDKNAGHSRAQDALAKAGDSTFGGSGGAIQTALNEQNIRQDRALTEAQLRDQAFRTGAGLSSEDAARRQAMELANVGARNQFGLANMDAQNRFGLANMDALNAAGQFNAGQQDNALTRALAAATGLGSLGAQEGADARANVTTQANIGDMLRAIQQQIAGAPLATAAGLTSMWSQLPLGLLHGQTADGTMNGTSSGTTRESGASLGDWLNYFASNARAAAAAGG